MEAHDILTMPLKNCHSDSKTDEGIGLEDTQVYGFLGVLWNLQNDTITPNQYLNVEKKIRGKREEVLLQQLSDDYLDSIEFEQGITRRVMSMVCAEIYDRLGRYLGILNSGI